MMRARCTSMVRGLIPSWRPASLLDAPRAIRSSTSRSRGVSCSSPEKAARMSSPELPRALAAARLDGVAHALHHRVRVEGLLDEVVGALPDGLHGHRDVALAGDHEHGRAVMGAEFVQHLQAGAPGHVHVQHDDVRRARAGRGQERGAVREGLDLEALHFEDQPQCVPHRTVIVDDEDVLVHLARLSHLPSPLSRRRPIRRGLILVRRRASAIFPIGRIRNVGAILIGSPPSAPIPILVGSPPSAPTVVILPRRPPIRAPERR